MPTAVPSVRVKLALSGGFGCCEPPSAHTNSRAIGRPISKMRIAVIGINPGIRPTGQDRTQAVFSYFKGPREQWKAELPTYASLVYADLWHGIDLVYSGTANQLKYTFLVHPGAIPGRSSWPTAVQPPSG